MTAGKQATGWAPYMPGDTITLRHRCGEDGQAHTATLEVRRTENVVGYDIGTYRFRVVAIRCDGSLVMIDVDHNGFDRDGRVTTLGVELADDRDPSDAGAGVR